MLIYIIVFIGVIIAGLAKYARTRELSGKLGRPVEDHELVSLNTWIEAERKEDARKGIKSEKSAAQVSKPRVANKTSINYQEATANPAAKVPKQQKETPDNCRKCGAALSKEISYCQFCGTHSSRKALEEHVSVFLDNLKKDFEDAIPAFHEQLRFGCLVIPLLALTGTVIAYFLMPQARATYAFLFGVPLLSLVVAYIWMNVVDLILTKKEAVIFNHFIEPKIQQFIRGNQLQPLEFVSLSKRHLNEHSKLLKFIYRRF